MLADIGGGRCAISLFANNQASPLHAEIEIGLLRSVEVIESVALHKYHRSAGCYRLVAELFFRMSEKCADRNSATLDIRQAFLIIIAIIGV